MQTLLLLLVVVVVLLLRMMIRKCTRWNPNDVNTQRDLGHDT